MESIQKLERVDKGQMKNTLFAFTDIHGDFQVLIRLLVDVTKVATFEKGVWTWVVKNTTVVCLGDFVDRFRLDQGEEALTTQQAIDDEIKIITCFESLQTQATIKNNNSNFIVLMGNHELGNIINLKSYYPYQIKDPKNKMQQSLRKDFVNHYLIPFASKSGVVLQWANYFFCHGGFEMEWLDKYNFDSIQEINRRWRAYVTYKMYDRLQMFADSDSVLMSRKMALQTDAWRENDKFDVSFLLSHELNPKFVLGHTTVFHIENDAITYNVPQCKNSNHSSFLSSRDYNGQDDIFFIDVSMSDGFMDSDSDRDDRYARRPQSLKLQVITDKLNGAILGNYCETMVMNDNSFKKFDNKHNPNFRRKNEKRTNVNRG